MFAALPPDSLDHLCRSRSQRRSYLAIYFLAQSLIALFYTSSGARKAYYGFVAPEGAVSSFAHDALPLLVTQKWLQTGDHPLLADFFVHHLWLAWPAHLLVIYIELFALLAVFRPELHRLWGLVLLTFHLLVWPLLGMYQRVLVALLFICSPFAPQSRPYLVQIAPTAGHR